MEALQPELEHRPVGLAEDVLTQLDDQVRPDAEDVVVERRVVELAESQSIRNDRLALRMPVRQDVSRVQQLGMAEPAHGAALAVGAEDAPPERFLVETALGQLGDVLTPGVQAPERRRR